MSLYPGDLPHPGIEPSLSDYRRILTVWATSLDTIFFLTKLDICAAGGI